MKLQHDKKEQMEKEGELLVEPNRANNEEEVFTHESEVYSVSIQVLICAWKHFRPLSPRERKTLFIKKNI